MPEFDERERPTGVLCNCCGGEGRILVESGLQYQAKACRWCDGTGVMTPEQLEAWRNRPR